MRSMVRALGAVAVVSALGACGGGGGSTAASSATLTGLAATGAAISGAAVSAKCVAGPVLNGTTDANGAFTLTLTSAHTAPCMLQLTGGTPSITLHSFAAASGQVNISPLTDMVVSKALGSDPVAAYAAFDSAKGSAINAGLVAAKAYVQTQVSTITGSGTADPLTSTFTVGSADDKVLDALGAALTAAGKTITDLRSGAQTGATLTASIPPFLGVPTAVVASASSTSQISISWGSVKGAAGYKLYRSTTAGSAGTLLASPVTSPYADTGLAAATTYYYSVTAVNGTLSSLASAQASATTNAASGTGGSTGTGSTGGTTAVELSLSTMPAVNTALCTDANPLPYGSTHAYTCPIAALATSFNLTIHGTASIPGATAKTCTYSYDGHNLTATDGTTTNVMPIGGTVPNSFVYSIPSSPVSGAVLGLLSTADASGSGISFSVQTIAGFTTVSGTVPTNKNGSPTVMCTK